MSTVPNARLPHERHAAQAVNLHRSTARCVPLWQVIVQPSANGPLILNVVAHSVRDAMEVVECWLGATSHRNIRFESVNLIGEVVNHDFEGNALLSAREEG